MECIRDLPRSVQYSMPQSNESASYGNEFDLIIFLTNKYTCNYIRIKTFSLFQQKKLPSLQQLLDGLKKPRKTFTIYIELSLMYFLSPRTGSIYL